MLSATNTHFIDLSKTQFTITPDGQYCYTLDAVVNSKAVQGHECWTVSSDTFTDRVGCMCDAINNAYYGYQTSVGASYIAPADQQLIYNDIVRQFLPFIQRWQLCDRQKFMAARNQYVNSHGMKDKATFAIMDQQTKLIQKALDANQCGTQSNWEMWVVGGFVIVIIVFFVFYILHVLNVMKKHSEGNFVQTSQHAHLKPTQGNKYTSARRATPLSRRSTVSR